MFTLYCITCSASSKRYIGMTKHTPEWRWGHHVRAMENGKVVTLLYRAMKKYGLAAFSIEAIASARTREDANHVERALIEQEKTLKPGGYNMTPGGDGASGLKWTYAQRQNSSRSQRIAQATPERRAQKSLVWKGKKRSLQDRANRSIAITAWWADRKSRGEKTVISPEGLERRRRALLGNQHTKGRKVPPEEVAKRKATMAWNKLDKRFNHPLWWKQWL